MALVQEGFATVHPIADKSNYWTQLNAAEDSAKQTRIGRWKDYVEEKEEEQRIEEEHLVSNFQIRKKKYSYIIVVTFFS